MAVRWMLASGQPDDWQGPAQGVRGGIQLYVTDDSGRMAAVVQLDVHDAGDLYQALEEHMENLAGDDVPTMTQEERDRALRKGRAAGVTRLDPDTHREEIRRRNLNAVREEIDRPFLVKGDGEEYTGPRVIVPSDEYRDLLAAKLAMEERASITPVWSQAKPVPPSQELLDAVHDLVAAWTNNGPHARMDHHDRVEAVAQAFPGLKGLLNRVSHAAP